MTHFKINNKCLAEGLIGKLVLQNGQYAIQNPFEIMVNQGIGNNDVEISKNLEIGKEKYYLL